MFLRRSNAGVQGVDIKIMPGDHVPRGDRALEKMDVLAQINNAARIIKIDQK